VGDDKKIVVVGGSAAGLKAAARARRLMPAAEIVVLEQRTFFSYGACGLPYYLSGDIESLAALREMPYGIVRDADFFARAKGVEVLTPVRVEAIDPEKQVVKAAHLESGESLSFVYDRLVLATGASPLVLPGVEMGPAVSFFHTSEQATALRRGLETGQVGSVIVVGAGFIGCELAGAFSDMWGCDVTLVEAADQVLPWLLDPDLASLVAGELRRNDIEVRTGAPVTAAVTEEGKAVVSVGDEILRADRAVIAAGVKPNVELAVTAGLKLGPRGGIVVDEFLQTSRPEIHAAGDCIEVTLGVTDTPALLPLGSLANRQGRVVGDNLAGKPTRFGEVVGSACIKIFDWNVAVTGVSVGRAEQAGLQVREAFGTFMNGPHYYPDHGKLFLKLVYEQGSQRLLGLQALGAGDTVKRADVFAALLHRDGKLEDLLDLEFCYAPPYNGAIDPLHALGCVALNQEETGITGVSPVSDPADRVVVDVRLADEITDEQPALPGAINIPLDELRERVNEIPRGKPLLIACAMGLRSAEAARWLASQGFGDIVYLAGGSWMRTRQ